MALHVGLSGLRPGRRARIVARDTAFGGGALTGLAAVTVALVRAEGKLARRTIGQPKELAPRSSGSWGSGRPDVAPLRVAVLGDSSAVGLGCQTPEQTPGALLAGGLARELDRRVQLDVQAVIGARAANLDPQIARALASPVDLAVILIGANDVTNRTPPAEAARDLARGVRTLKAAGAVVVVGTCPDLGTVAPLWQPLRSLAAIWSRRMAREQTIAVVEAGATTVSLGDLLGREFGATPGLWSADRFHPSALGYARVVDVLLPAALQALGVDVPTAQRVRETVHDVELAAAVAARDPGLVVETLEGEQGAAAVGPGRLARLRRRVPLARRGAPEGRTPGTPAAAGTKAGPVAT